MSNLAVNQETSLTEMNDLAAEIASLRSEEKQAADVKSEISKRLEEKEQRVMDLLLEHGLSSYKAPDGTMSLSQRFSAKLPQGEDRLAFFAYLKELGKFDELVGIASTTYTSYVKEQYELAQERGEGEPVIPGVTEVKLVPRLSFRQSR